MLMGGTRDLLIRLRGRQCEGNDLAAIPAARKMFEHSVALGWRKRALGESGEQVGIGMFDRQRRCLQALAHDLGYSFHLADTIPGRPRRSAGFRLAFAFADPGLHSLF